MKKISGVSIIIPVYNEEKNISEIIDELIYKLGSIDISHEIIVIDDGSTDNTKNIVLQKGVKVVSHPKNMGYGQAILTGIKNAQYEYIATIDADGSYLAEDLVRLIEEVNGFDLVIGARKGKEFWGSLLKQPARLLFLLLAEFTVGEKIPDVNSGLRIFKKSAFEQIKLPVLCRGFSFSSTMTLAFLSEGKFVKFVPIKYLPRKGKSKVNYIKDTLRTLQALVEIITFYNPLKLIVLIIIPIKIVAVVCLALWIITRNFWWGLYCVLLFGLAIITFLSGLILDLMRMKK